MVIELDVVLRHVVPTINNHKESADVKQCGYTRLAYKCHTITIIINAEQRTKISKPDIEVILYARRLLLFTKNKPWIKCTGNSSFDVAMGSYDGVEICELVGMYILDRLSKIHAKCDVGLYRDDGLAVIRNATGRMGDRT